VADLGAFAFHELTASPADRALLGRFYAELYVPEFPDPDERESLANMERYLELKASGWYGRNNYHIGLVLEGEAPVAGVIIDYLAEANAGVLEFLVVAASRRNRGLATRVFRSAGEALDADAERALGTPPDWIMAEINDPFRPRSIQDSVDPFARLAIWSAWGFAKLDFPYVQPALSADQRPVRNLLLAAKALRPELRERVPAGRVETVVREYLRWAMRIEEPESCPEFQAMRGYLRTRSTVAMIALAHYVGRDPARPLEVHEIIDPDDPDLDAALAVYREAFPPGPTVLSPDAWRRELSTRHQDRQDVAYHLWALRGTPDGAVAGMASFFTFPGAGFGGYVALVGALRHARRLPLLIARIEARMLQDGLGAVGWYIECQHNSRAAVAFTRLGFHEVALTYRQPRLGDGGHEQGDASPELLLLYKEFGRSHEPPRLARPALLETIGRLFRVVYGVRLEDDGNFADVRRQAEAWPDDAVRWRPEPAR
jgi:hypothetical protein